ncbi:CLUMA_CG021124, isoform A [Clunio marinus]|uniref:CLUMA_CG021124, isoform A n=1 Tax=Clunio marinus TaxID=568069 RepID=A0A1J1J6B3_9DIPT|nr:CLUMA_CG021124, isoform A [Clunio marinus]
MKGKREVKPLTLLWVIVEGSPTSVEKYLEKKCFMTFGAYFHNQGNSFICLFRALLAKFG